MANARRAVHGKLFANREFNKINTNLRKNINKNNLQENVNRIPHIYRVGDQVLLRRGTENKYETPYSGPHPILQVNNNGTVRLQVGAVTDTYNIRRLTPYTQPPQHNHGGECSMQESRVQKRRRLA